MLNGSHYSTEQQSRAQASQRYKAPVPPEIQDPKATDIMLSIDPDLRFQLMELLQQSDFETLESTLEEYVSLFDSGELRRKDIEYLFKTFEVANPDYEQKLASWLQHSRTWSSLVANGVYSFRNAWEWRDTSYWRDVPELNRRKYKEYLQYAYDHFQQALTGKPRDDVFINYLVTTKLNLGLDSKQTIITSALKDYPHVDKLYHLAANFMQPKWGGKEMERRELIYRAEKLANKDEKLSSLKGLTSYYEAIGFEKANSWQAIQSYREAIKQNPKSTAYRVAIAELYIEIRRFEKALEVLDIVDRYRPNRVELLHLRAKALNGLGKTEEALTVLDRLFQQDLNHRDANLFALRLHSSAGNKEAAENAIQRVLYFASEEPYELNLIASMYRNHLNEVELAEKFYKRALEARRFDPWASFRLSEIYLENGSCDAVDSLDTYFIGCNNQVGQHEYYCTTRNQDWAWQTVQQLKDAQNCPKVFEKTFDGEIPLDDLIKEYDLEHLIPEQDTI
ncbi:hypothetical protein GCM10008090_14880 [Arenicella chitinivorans]|uniref:Tetratricopeptide repeat protein n=2 Tax=Arenicella chitinivorans TaxID=1329800 RepID=A0A918RP94_9GAMM|nr:hypothetical protein GCM10008090_14880 [Arenicella chitinivorans]